MEKLINKFVKIVELTDGQLELASTVVTVLKYFQAWPIIGRTRLKGQIYYAFVMFYCNIILMGSWGHVIKLYNSPEFTYNALAVDFAILGVGTSGYQFNTHMFRHRYLAKRLLKEMGNFRHYDKPAGIEMADAVLNGIFKAIIVTIVLLTPVLLAILWSETCEENDYSCGFLYPAYIPGMMTPLRRRLFLVVQLSSAWTYSLMSTGCVWVIMQMAEYIVAYLKHCQMITKHTTLITNFERRKEHVKYVLRYHQRILFLYKNFHKLAKGVFLIHATSTPVVMAMMLHTFMIDFQIQVFLIFAIWTMSLFVVCFMGQRMLNESKTLANIVYETIPQDGDLTTAKMLLLMLQQTQRPLRIPAGSLTFCEFELVSTALKATYSYMALLQRTNQMATNN